MKYIKRFKNESDYQTFRGGADWITPNVSVINDKNEVKLVPQKKVNYISYFYDGTDVWIKSTYPVTSSICIQHSFSAGVGLFNLDIGENSKKLSALPPGEDLTTGSINGIGFNADDAWNDNETLEDETYIYQIEQNLILFYIDDDVDVYEYTIRKPITWEQFVDSDYTQQHSDVLYNWRLEYFGSYYRVVVYHEYNGADVAILFDTYESIPLTSTDTIINGHVYRAH